jgi:TonB-linked SusC/RagA family outer membrane protein
MQSKAFYKASGLAMPYPAQQERSFLSKTILLMKLTAILLLAGMLQVYAGGYSQTVTLSEKDATLHTIFEKIKKQTGFTFFYNESLLEQAGRVSIEVNKAPLTRVLDLCLQSLAVDYAIIDNTVVIRSRLAGTSWKAEEAYVPPSLVMPGRVISKQGEALANTTITLKRTKKTIMADANGLFVLHDIQPGDVIVVSFIGYKTQEVTIADGKLLTITMEVADSQLDEIIIQGYGTTDRRRATGNIAKVSAEEIGTQPVMNPLLALAGRVAGLVVTPTSGYASGTVKLEIRGRKMVNSIFVSDPLYIIDGVPLTTLDVGGSSNYNEGSSGFVQNGTTGPAMGQSPLFSLNPADIESIEVLKDADATAIYGSRGANGVILITTKKGVPGITRFNISASQGISLVTGRWEMMNTPQYLQMRREAFKNDGLQPTTANAPDLLVWDTTRYTDWQKELWGNQGKQTNIAASMSGGDARTQFRVSTNYIRQTEILTNSGANQRASLSFNLNHASLNRKFKVEFTSNYSYALVNTISIASAATLPPNAPPIYNSKGELNFKEWNDAGLQYSYPFTSLGSPYTSSTNFLTSNIILRYEIVKGLELSGSFGYNNSQNTNRTRKPIAVQNPILNPTGEAFAGSTNNNNWIIEPQLNYKINIGAGKLAILVGATTQTNRTRGLGTSGYGYTNDALLESIALAPVTYQTDKYGEYKYAAVFGRINYNWNNKYILNLNARRDGSSRFGPDKQVGNFGSAGMAWIASEENWVKKNIPSFISFIKLRGSYGLTGSDAVGDYQYLSQWSSSGDFARYASYGGITPLISQHAVNEDYHWQVNKKLETAMSIGFLKDKINLELAYYRDRCDNQLTRYPLPAYTGFSAVTANWPATVQNSGWELTLSARLIENDQFSWSVNGNGAFNNNILLKYPGLELSPYAATYRVGYSLNTRFLAHNTGVNPSTGQFSFEDYNHDGTILAYSASVPGVAADDKYIAKNLSPQFTGGFGTDLRYRNFRLGLFFSVKKQEAVNAYYSAYSNAPGSMANQPAVFAGNHWQKPGDQVQFARFSTSPPISNAFYQWSDGAFTDASFIRLSNLSFAYDLPKKMVKKLGMQQCSFFLHAQNVFVITGYDGLDPENPGFGTLPLARMFSGGLSFNF